MKPNQKYTLYDNAGTIFRVPPNFYENGIKFVKKYVEGRGARDTLVANLTARKEKKENTTPQELFSLLCQAFVTADREEEYVLSGEKLLYLDAVPVLEEDQLQGRKRILLTSGTSEYNERFLNLVWFGDRR